MSPSLSGVRRKSGTHPALLSMGNGEQSAHSVKMNANLHLVPTINSHAVVLWVQEKFILYVFSDVNKSSKNVTAN